MYEISGLAMRDIPYGEYVSSAEELHVMEESTPLVYAQVLNPKCPIYELNALTIDHFGF